MSIKAVVDLSFIVTAFNSDRFIEYCLESVISQVPKNICTEIIIVNDGSSDRTGEIARKYEHKVNIVNLASNEGVERAANIGIRASTGRYICRVDADDALGKNFLSAASRYLDGRNQLIYGDYNNIDINNKIIGRMTLPDFSESEVLQRGDFLATGTIFMREVFEKVGGYSERVKNSGLENYELIVKFIKFGVQAVHIGECIFEHRFHGENMSLKRKNSIEVYGKEIMQEQFGMDFKSNHFHPHQNW